MVTVGLLKFLFLLFSLNPKPRAWNSILFCGPGSEIDQLASLGAERTPGIIFPAGGIWAERAPHTEYCTTVRLALLLRVSLDGSDRKQMPAIDG